MFRRVALFDIAANNADRKGGHCLLDAEGDDLDDRPRRVLRGGAEAAHGDLDVRRRAAARRRRRGPRARARRAVGRRGVADDAARAARSRRRSRRSGTGSSGCWPTAGSPSRSRVFVRTHGRRSDPATGDRCDAARTVLGRHVAGRRARHDERGRRRAAPPARRAARRAGARRRPTPVFDRRPASWSATSPAGSASSARRWTSAWLERRSRSASSRSPGRSRTASCGPTGTSRRAAGRPGAARAAGSTLAHSPIEIFVPCHRVVPGRSGARLLRRRRGPPGDAASAGTRDLRTSAARCENMARCVDR